MSSTPFFTVVGEWPWQWLIYHTPKPRESPPPRQVTPPAKRWKLVDWIAEDTGLSRGKARCEIALGHVQVNGFVETNADRMLPGEVKVEWTTST